MKCKLTGIVFFLFSVFTCYAGFTGNIMPENIVNTFQARKGLSNFFTKIEKGDTVRVAYLGGSITAQQGWRVYSLEWFRQRFPKAHFVEINAAIGGTGSDFGAFRLKSQVLEMKPDLLFVEFAVNDSGTSEDRILRSMEGIVRQTWQDNPLIDICFVYTIKESFLDVLRNGKNPLSVQAMERIAEQYQIPSINFGLEVYKMVKQEKLIFRGDSEQVNGAKVFSPDGVHPYPETGQKIYHEVLKRAFNEMQATGKIAIRKHKMSSATDSSCFAFPQMISWDKTSLNGSWNTIVTADNPVFRDFSPTITKVGEAGNNATLTFSFKGSAFGFYDIVGPGAGRIEVEIDNQRKDTLIRFDEYCTYWRINYFLIDKLENKAHFIKVRVLPEPFDKVAILSKRGGSMQNTEQYKNSYWYPVKVLLNGDLLVISNDNF